MHKSKLGDFRIWLLDRGWVEEPLKSDYEVLRMRHSKERHPLIIHTTLDAKEHLTVWGVSEKYFKAYMHWKKPSVPKPRPEFDPLRV